MNSRQKKLNVFKTSALLAVSLLPAVSFAATTPSCSSIKDLFGFFGCLFSLVQSAIVVIGALALMFFLWNLVMYIKEYDNETKRQESRQYMIYGIIALFVMVSVWGLVDVLTTTFGVSTGTPTYRTR